MDIIKSLDFYTKFSDDFTKKTTTGGALAITSFLSMIILFYFRFMAWIHPPVETQFFVPSPSLPFKTGRIVDPDNLPKMDINFDFYLYHMPCSYVHVDVFDVIKESDDSIESRIKMIRYDQNQNQINAKPFPKEEEPAPEGYCGSCYGVKEGCCNTCRDVRKAFKAKRKPLPSIATIEQCTREGYLDELKKMKGESCRIYGSVSVHEHPGTLHVTPGDSLEEDSASEIFEKIGFDISSLNISHRINTFNFGKMKTIQSSGRHQPLNNYQMVQEQTGRLKSYYFLRVVPLGQNHDGYSIGVSMYKNYRKNTSRKVPGIFFNYDISPISVNKGTRQSTMEFLVEISAILGGVFALFSFVDAIANKIVADDQVLTKAEQYQLLRNNL
ncbi:hypothetical protein TRFO_09944 [Tritrichomonas foetus]|uniref:Endoplasmic reticulum-Golgi intermediate compartment protein 3 n=1 Tax=Tritrichomonas foetus TaxID=1144522 RepID=A0A1J4JCY3_9EUKA|nr:hypothetical protein TRFO_09944 [Tritrichomonas foetus]|eukprot:OHS96545.1 hypothetical protein TRFO_09944 [Tritrichomonas foetus]